MDVMSRGEEFSDRGSVMGEEVGATVGRAEVGEAVLVGETVGEVDGLAVGEAVLVGEAVGEGDGLAVGEAVLVGEAVGEDNLFCWHGNVRGSEGALEGVVIHFSLTFQNTYPDVQPAIHLMSPVPHPNVRRALSDGPGPARWTLALWDCIPSFKGWTSCYTVLSILVQLQVGEVDGLAVGEAVLVGEAVGEVDGLAVGTELAVG
eukprot:gene22956-27765_t